ncbi:hypothetical protein F9C07_3044 [Aspergillus flavus]|uniref:Uncharacterized protein n=1 Tax=Aspergillus flavus (strain ATCC 200026 / FGSC A1120 / IAM 13836 / NRRL 3357 / JCM 12722 / SRRC 167) TaxID=332952 RepID=A0A7U2ME52_ASPFN|nr:hypothetical protein F9C07_3044 [Aspergillus flavus]
MEQTTSQVSIISILEYNGWDFENPRCPLWLVKGRSLLLSKVPATTRLSSSSQQHKARLISVSQPFNSCR